MSNRELDVPDGNGKMRHVYPVSQTTYGQPAGIWGINCHHGPMNVFIPGFSYVRGEDVKPDKNENDRLYALTQEQRQLERQVRYAKRDAAMYDAAGDKASFEQAALKVKDTNAKLKSFVNSHDSLVLSNDRTWVLGYNKGVSSRSTAAYKTNLHKQFKGYLGTNNPTATARKYKEIVNAGDERLLSGFIRAVDKGDINVLVGIDGYISVARSIEKELIGITCVDGTQIKAYATHFIDRVIGQTSEWKDGMRMGVTVVQVRETLLNGIIGKTVVSKSGAISIKIIGIDNEVAINPDTGTLIQTNPRR